jgi:hypothetical protein
MNIVERKRRLQREALENAGLSNTKGARETLDVQSA